MHSYCPVRIWPFIWYWDIESKFGRCYEIHWILHSKVDFYLRFPVWLTATLIIILIMILTSNDNFKQIINFAISSLGNDSFSCQLFRKEHYLLFLLDSHSREGLKVFWVWDFWNNKKDIVITRSTEYVSFSLYQLNYMLLFTPFGNNPQFICWAVMMQVYVFCLMTHGACKWIVGRKAAICLVL